MNQKVNLRIFLFLLPALASVTPLAMDTYLPSMPEIAESLNVGIEKIEVTISIFLIFYAFGQLFGGIVSDRLGRKKSALIGLLAFSLTSFALFFSDTLPYLYILRALEAFTGGFTVVNSPAIVRDISHGKEAAKIFSTIASVTMLAPLIAPGIGTVIVAYFTWHYIFIFLGLYALIVAIMIALKLPITGSKSKTKVFQAYKKVLTHKIAITYILTQAFAFSGLFVFIEKSSFIYREYFEVEKNLFPFVFGMNVLVLIGLTRLNIKLVQNISPRKILRFAIFAQFGAGLLLVILANFPLMWLIFGMITIYIGVMGLTFANSMALALEFFKEDSGVANSVIGVTQSILAGIIGFLATLLPNENLLPIFLTMAGTSFLAIIMLFLNGRNKFS